MDPLMRRFLERETFPSGEDWYSATGAASERETLTGDISAGRNPVENPNLQDQQIGPSRFSTGVVGNVFWSQRANDELTLRNMRPLDLPRLQSGSETGTSGFRGQEMGQDELHPPYEDLFAEAALEMERQTSIAAYPQNEGERFLREHAALTAADGGRQVNGSEATTNLVVQGSTGQSSGERAAATALQMERAATVRAEDAGQMNLQELPLEQIYEALGPTDNPLLQELRRRLEMASGSSRRSGSEITALEGRSIDVDVQSVHRGHDVHRASRDQVVHSGNMGLDRTPNVDSVVSQGYGGTHPNGLSHPTSQLTNVRHSWNAVPSSGHQAALLDLNMGFPTPLDSRTPALSNSQARTPSLVAGSRTAALDLCAVPPASWTSSTPVGFQQHQEVSTVSPTLPQFPTPMTASFGKSPPSFKAASSSQVTGPGWNSAVIPPLPGFGGGRVAQGMPGSIGYNQGLGGQGDTFVRFGHPSPPQIDLLDLDFPVITTPAVLPTSEPAQVVHGSQCSDLLGLGSVPGTAFASGPSAGDVFRGEVTSPFVSAESIERERAHPSVGYSTPRNRTPEPRPVFTPGGTRVPEHPYNPIGP